MTNDISGTKAKLNFSNTIIIPLMLMGFYFAMLGHIKSKADFKIYFITLLTKIRPLKIKLRETVFSKIVSVDNAELIPGQMSFTLRE